MPSNDRQRLESIAESVVRECPDLWQMARDAAHRIIAQHTNKVPDPDQVWFHRFDNAQSNGRSFTGWEHVGPPLESLTLPQLVCRRFNHQDQDNSDLLDQMGGFYHADAHIRRYDDTNEVPMLARDVLQDLWKIDFASAYRHTLGEFWAHHQEDYRTLAKLNCLSLAKQAMIAGQLHPEHFSAVLQALAPDYSSPPTLTQLQRREQPKGGITVHGFAVGPFVATDMLRIELPTGLTLLYVPNTRPAFHAFETLADLHAWIAQQCSAPDSLLAFMSHFPFYQQLDSQGRPALHDALMLTVSSQARGDHSLLEPGPVLTEDAFDLLTRLQRSRMEREAETVLTDNARLRKQLWLGYLATTAQLAGLIGTLCWPVALVAAGADAAALGLGIDQALHGQTTADRHEGVLASIVASVDLLFNSAVVIGRLGSVRSSSVMPHALPEQAATTAARFSTMPPHVLERFSPALSDFETNIVLRAPTQSEGPLRGVHLQGGQLYITLDGLPYQVRHFTDLDRWAIVMPDDPWSFSRFLPVIRNTDDTWQIVGQPGLKGGGRFFGLRPWGASRSARQPLALPASPYDMPERNRSLLERASRGLDRSLVSDDLVAMHDAPLQQAVENFRNLRQQLLHDASEALRSPALPPTPELPEFPRPRDAKGVIRRLFAHTQSLCLGEQHSAVSSKRWLIENMGNLFQQGVRTLYMEHLLIDFHQSDLLLFNQTGKLGEQLKRYVQDMDIGFHTDPTGRYTFEALLNTAYRQHIRIQALDCMASYRLSGIEDPAARYQAFSFHADRLIRADQSINGQARWVALVGNSHTNRFEGVPGLADLSGGLGLRMEDVTPLVSEGISLDDGAWQPRPLGRADAFVQANLLWRMRTLPAPATLPGPPAPRLSRPGQFFLDHRDGLVLVHKARTGEEVRTPIRVSPQSTSLHRPSWPQISDHPFADLNEMVLSLRQMGLEEAP